MHLNATRFGRIGGSVHKTTFVQLNQFQLTLEIFKFLKLGTYLMMYIFSLSKFPHNAINGIVFDIYFFPLLSLQLLQQKTKKYFTRFGHTKL